MPDAAELIEQALAAGLVHPGTGKGPIALPMPGINNNSIPPEMAEQFAKDAGLPHSNIPKLIAEALAHALQAGGAALAEDIKTRTAAADVQPVTAPTPPQQPRPQLQQQRTVTGDVPITVNGETINTREFIAKHTKEPMTAPLYARVLIVAYGKAITDQQTNAPVDEWTMSYRADGIDITTR